MLQQLNICVPKYLFYLKRRGDGLASGKGNLAADERG
jgi:hypothetical protein